VDHLARLRRVNATTKRGARGVGIQTWFPYYAGFSEQWAALALGALALRNDAVVLDPWNGSGTTTRMAALMGYEAQGIDLNPVASVIASAKLANAADAEHLEGIFSQIVLNAKHLNINVRPDDPLRAWLSRELCSAVRRLLQSTLSLLATKPDGSTVDPFTEPPPPLASLFTLCLLRAARKVARIREASNPTWFSPEGIGCSSEATLLRHMRACAEQFARDLSSNRACVNARIELGDARCLKVETATVDAILTSPPYCTRLDYVVSTSFELAVLGANGATISTLRRTSMGTPLMRREDAETDSFGKKTSSLLEKIKRHPSKNSDNYYYPSYVQYFSDARRALCELARVTKRKAPIVMVLQSSYYKEIPIDLSSLYLDIAAEHGMYGERVQRQPVKKVLTDINRSARKHLSSRKYYEDVIVLEAR
jgi:tRNA G10  N-methylase Trm11